LTGSGTGGTGFALDNASSSTFLNNYVTTEDGDLVQIWDGSVNNTFINNTLISTGGGYGLRFEDASQNNTFTNNTISSGSDVGIYIIDSSDNNTFTNNIVSSISDYGLQIDSSSNMILTNNTISSNSTYGAYIFNSSSNNTFTDNTFTSNGSNALRLDKAVNNTFINQTARTLWGVGANRMAIYMNASNDTIFRDCINISGGSYHVYYYNFDGSSNNTFINCSYDLSTNISKEYINGVLNNLTRAWYYQAYVNYSNSTEASDVNVSAYNTSDIIQFTEQTNASGWIQRQEVIEYVNTAGTTSYYSNYTINASMAGYTTDNNIINFTISQNKVDDFFTLTTDNIPPTYTENSTNNTFAGGYTLFAINVTDEKALEPNGMYIFSTNNTGTWVNETGVNFATISEWANVTKTLNSTAGTFVGYRWFFNDTIGNMNSTPIYTLTTAQDCGTLSTAYGNYTLISNVSSTETCFTITGENITLDCQNNWITYSIEGKAGQYGIYIQAFNATIKNCNVLDGNWTTATSTRYGIPIDDTYDNSTIFNNFVNVSNTYGIYLSGDTNFNNVTNNTCVSNSGSGIVLNTASNNNFIIGNNVSSTSSYGIYVLGNSNNNSLINNTAKSNSNNAISISSSSNNTLINNTALNNGVTGYSAGIAIGNSPKTTLIDNNGTQGNDGSGIYVDSSRGSVLINNTGVSQISKGIYLSNSSNCTLTNNIGTSDSSYGIYILSGSNNNILTNQTGITNTGYGIYIRESTNNTFIMPTARTLGATGASRYGVYIYLSNDTIFRDCINISGGTKDVYYANTTGNMNNTFINCSYTTSKETVQNNSELIRKWYYQAYVNFTNSTPVENANVTAYNTSSITQFTEQTNASGWIQRQEIIEYNNTGGTRSYYSNYTINASMAGYATDNNIINFTISQNKLDDFFTLDGDTPPEITVVYNATEMTDVSSGPIEGPVATYILINFTAYDAQGFGNLNDSAVKINFSLAGEEPRINSSCALLGDYDTNYANYTCNVTMWWWDAPGTWTINASIEDNEGNSGFNDSTTFALGETTGFLANATQLNWPEISPGAINQEANESILLNNTGNKQMSIEINATDLIGENNPAYALGAINFSVHTAAGCGGTSMSHYVYTTVVGATIPKGNYSLNDGTAQEVIYFCLEESNSGLIAQPYSTTQEGTWRIRIFLAAFTIRRRKKKDSKKYVLERLTIPITIFSRELGALESVVKYMKENLQMNYNAISELLNRNQKTIWTAYHKAIEKQSGIISIEKKDGLIPIDMLRNRKLTVLESTIIYLKGREMKFSEIAELLERDQRNIRTTYLNAIKKLNPATIFTKELGTLESITKYMKENLGMSYHKIAELLNRDERTIWTAYNKARIKQKELIEIKETEIFLPISIFVDREYTPLESIIIFLKKYKFKYSEIAKLLNRNQRNIWAIYNRIKNNI
jgi:parallel beta-helix repeat protein